jgi:5-methylcytosine-specific restriction endonuclease McrA
MWTTEKPMLNLSMRFEIVRIRQLAYTTLFYEPLYPEKIKAKRKNDWAKKTPEERRFANENVKTWHQEHPEKTNNWHYGWEKKNPEKRACSIKKYRSSPKGIISNRRKVKQHTHMVRANGPLDIALFYQKCGMLGWKCQLCKKELDESTATIDHIVPVSLGGTNDIDNLQPLCHSCNCRKGNRPMSAYVVAVVEKTEA